MLKVTNQPKLMLFLLFTKQLLLLVIWHFEPKPSPKHQFIIYLWPTNSSTVQYVSNSDCHTLSRFTVLISGCDKFLSSKTGIIIDSMIWQTARPDWSLSDPSPSHCASLHADFITIQMKRPSCKVNERLPCNKGVFRFLSDSSVSIYLCSRPD